MNLSIRLRTNSPNRGSGTWFIFGKTYIQSYADLIDFVLERFARRFGRISNEIAYKLQEKLAIKYCNGHCATFRKLRSDYECGFSYPKELAHEISIVSRMQKWELQNLYNDPDGIYCPVPNFPSYQLGCGFCNAKTLCNVKPKCGKNYDVDMGVYLFGSHICKSKKCRAIACLYKKNQSYETKLIDVLLGVIKNDGSNQQFSRLKKHFI